LVCCKFDGNLAFIGRKALLQVKVSRRRAELGELGEVELDFGLTLYLPEA
jgi:hypothetical protein